jgi:DNA-binding transcriptional ArsR family regulator
MRAAARQRDSAGRREGARRDPFDALGNSNRRAIVELLADQPRSVREIADELPISRPAVSRHLRVLNHAGLVVDQRAGTRHLYRLDQEGAEAARRYLEQVWGQVSARFSLFAANTVPARSRPVIDGARSRSRSRNRKGR